MKRLRSTFFVLLVIGYLIALEYRLNLVKRKLKSIKGSLHSHSYDEERSHTHSEYAKTYHSHSEYADDSHDHYDYADDSHSHSEYAEDWHTH